MTSLSDQTVKRHVGAFYDAVVFGNRAEAAKYASFAWTYFLNGKRLSLKNSAAFLEQYDHIFSPEFVAKMPKRFRVTCSPIGRELCLLVVRSGSMGMGRQNT